MIFIKNFQNLCWIWSSSYKSRTISWKKLNSKSTRRRFIVEIKVRKRIFFDVNDVLLYHERAYVFQNEVFQLEFLKRHHDNSLTEHFEFEKTNELLSRKYYWSNMFKDIKYYVNICDSCQRMKTFRHRSYDKLNALSQSKNSWQEIIMNFIIDLSRSKWRDEIYNVCLVIIDRYIKMILYIAYNKKITTVELTELVFEKVILQYDMSFEIVLNKDSVFTSVYWLKICYYLKIKRRLNTVFHSQTNEQMKRQNQILEHYLKVYCTKKQNNWIKLLSIAQFVYQNSVHSVLRISSFYIMYEYNSSSRYDAENIVKRKKMSEAKARVKKLHELRETLTKSWQQTVESTAKHHNFKQLIKNFKSRIK